MKPCPSVTPLVLIGVVAGAEATRAQRPQIPTEVTVEESGSVGIGANATLTFVRGEPFERVDPGYGVQAFVSVPFHGIHEVRGGVTLGSHNDALAETPVTLRGAYIETHWGLAFGHFRLHAGPRMVWLQQSRSLFARKLSGFGLGAATGLTMVLSSRVALDAGLGVTSVALSAADLAGGRPDPDRRSQGTLWELRLGTVFRP